MANKPQQKEEMCPEVRRELTQNVRSLGSTGLASRPWAKLRSSLQNEVPRHVVTGHLSHARTCHFLRAPLFATEKMPNCPLQGLRVHVFQNVFPAKSHHAHSLLWLCFTGIISDYKHPEVRSKHFSPPLSGTRVEAFH